ncbi:SDR family oxidoreductase [Endozoicomonas sp.]|uniref:SDR family oxidoreductase n=1 Tax=Endozoicomonas sp. TaxID=1892382 RepID=UPI003AF8625B
MPQIPYKTALVTGASSGIGSSVVKALTEQGITVYALARRADRLNILAKQTGAIPMVLDICDTDELYQQLTGLDVDILVSNAGLGIGSTPLHKASREEVTTAMNTNLLAAMHLINIIAPGMVARSKGHIIHLGSIAGLYPLFSSVYGASKGGIHMMCQNLRLELKGTPIRCTEICPGRVETEFFEKAYKDPKVVKKIMTEITLLKAEDIADAVLYALAAPARVNIGLIELTPTEQMAGGLISQPAHPSI